MTVRFKDAGDGRLVYICVGTSTLPLPRQVEKEMETGS